ncbi:50S ribosomal protein L4 [Candidatus Giovannonibacteria bacterium]|nr:50S ribosomal protein L4 [Candidatus Giovannonibacteria bacterium]
MPPRKSPKTKGVPDAGRLEARMYNEAGREVGAIVLPPKVFGVAFNPDLAHYVLESMRRNARPTVAHSKGRSEVSGGGRKPWRQKGTGRARHGSIRSPIWIGGGVTHGPRSERSYERKINKKMRRQALLSALSEKLRGGEILFLEKLQILEAKTKRGAELLQNLSRVEGFEALGSKRVLVLLPANDRNTIRSLRNLGKVEVMEAKNSNPADVLSSKFLLIPKDSVKILEETFLK